MAEQPILALTELGQSVWYDYIRRDLLGPRLTSLIADGLRGMTSNPTIFEKAIADTDLYDEDIRSQGPGASAEAVFESVMVSDIRRAADIFLPVYEATEGDDGFVSIEVDPRLARDTSASLAAARHLFEVCDRPNVMVKIPGTREGLSAIRRCLADGININITLLFSVERYEQVIEAYLSALEERLDKGLPIDRLRSVASFFVSRVDTLTDRKLDAIAADGSRREDERALARELRGKIAIANAKRAYSKFERAFCGSDRFTRLYEQGGRAQRPLWASTSTKDPSYPELYYVEALVAPGSVDTMPPSTFEAYRSGGEPKVRIYDQRDEAREALNALSALGLDLNRIADELEDEGVSKFASSYEDALRAVARKQAMVTGREAPPSPPTG